jgi:hypothetical protein
MTSLPNPVRALLVVVVVLVLGGCSAESAQPAPQSAPETGEWASWPTRGDLAADDKLRAELLASPELRAIAPDPGAAHVLWLGGVPAGGGSVPTAVVAVERRAPGQGVRPGAPADVALLRRADDAGDPGWGAAQPVAPFDPADPGIDVAALGDLDPAAGDAYLMRRGVADPAVVRVGGSRSPVAVRPDGVAMVPAASGGGPCTPPFLATPGHLLLPGVSAPLEVRAPGDEAGLVAVASGLTCGPTAAGPAGRIDLLASSITVSRHVGGLPGPAGAVEVAHVRAQDATGVRETLAMIPPDGSAATVGAAREGDGDAYDPLAVRIAGAPGTESLLVKGGNGRPATVPGLPVQADGGSTVLFGPVSGPVAVVGFDPSGAPSKVDLVR